MENGFQKEREQLKKMKRTVESCPFRTRYHIMPPVGWLNDPNGLCQFRGVYHAYLSGRYDAAHQRSESMERKRKIFYGSWRTQKRLGFQGKPMR